MQNESGRRDKQTKWIKGSSKQKFGENKLIFEKLNL